MREKTWLTGKSVSVGVPKGKFSRVYVNKAQNKMNWAVPGITAGSENSSPQLSQVAFIEKKQKNNTEEQGLGVWLKVESSLACARKWGGVSIPRSAKDGRKVGGTEKEKGGGRKPELC